MIKFPGMKATEPYTGSKELKKKASRNELDDLIEEEKIEEEDNNFKSVSKQDEMNELIRELSNVE